MGRDARTPAEIFDDMLADDRSLEEIARRLGWTLRQARQRYKVICGKLGEPSDDI